MSEASLAAQRLAVTTMRAASAVTDLVPALSIFDRSGRPETFPCIILGEGQTVGDEAECVIGSEVFLDIDVWTRETGFVDCKTIAGAIRRALRGLSGIQDGFALDFAFEDARFLRDPSGEHSHGVVRFVVTAEDLVGI